MKKLLAVLLAVLMLVPVISLGVSAAYKENNNFDVIYPELSALESDEEIYPTIILPGINHSKYYVADENGNVMTDKKGNALEESLLLINQDVCGVIEAPEAESKSFSGFSVLKIFSDVLYVLFKGNGFFEKL